MTATASSTRSTGWTTTWSSPFNNGADCNYKDADPTNYDFALVFDFVSFEALNAYQVHPEHLKLKALLKDKIQARSCIDYEI